MFFGFSFLGPGRYTKLGDKDILQRLVHVCQAEGVASTPDGLEAAVFTADGDMRQALNSLQVGGEVAYTPLERAHFVVRDSTSTRG